jgi:hypothetical protein
MEIKSILATRGFAILKLVVDGDTRFDVSSVPCVVERVAAGSHVNVAERCIRTVKERARAIRASLPFTVPKLVARELVKYCVSMLNLF